MTLLPRCPFRGDSYRTQMVALDRAELPFSSHYQRFTVATFTLLDSSSQRALRGEVRRTQVPRVWPHLLIGSPNPSSTL
jgi:hypothetical protein